FPSTFVGRIIAITVLPLLLAVILSGQFFYDRHWEETGKQLARTLTNQIKLVVSDTQSISTKEYPSLFKKYEIAFGFKTKFYEKSPIVLNRQHDFQTHYFRHFVRHNVKYPVYTYVQKKEMTIYAVLPHGILEIKTPLNMVYQSTIHIFLAWIAGSFFLIVLLMTPFVYTQIRSIKRLTRAAQRFGRGEDSIFRPSGAKEIRQAGQSFLLMRHRIKQFVDSRTQMLAAISHDLRTPLTRMKLTLEMMSNTKNTEDLQQDIQEMEKMIDGYLTFAREETKEPFEKMTLEAVIKDIKRDFRHSEKRLEIESIPNVIIRARYMDLKRAFSNLIKNALAYGKKKVHIEFRRRREVIEIIIDDDGVGIPADKREQMLKPFQRMDESRSSKKESVGLGLTIAHKLIDSHSGKLTLDESPMGGLRVIVELPI
ncbi:MAG: ATP-binding protein, partial [Alphaproteobacteria bacterium]|nr:ATP-binding protein [Alphaproteobacteria bacterium]